MQPLPAVEGDPVTVCTRLTFEGSTNELQSAITVYLNATDGKAAGNNSLSTAVNTRSKRVIIFLINTIV